MIVDWSNGENIYVCIISARKVTTHETKHYEWVIVMRDEYDFSKGERGDFYRPNAKVHLPLYLDDDVQAALISLATAKGKDYSAFVNDLLKKNIELILLARQ